MATIHVISGLEARRTVRNPWNWVWTRDSNSQISAVPRGLGGCTHLSDNSADLIYIFICSNKTLTLDLSVTGAGGLHDDYSEASDQGYDIYFCGGVAASVAGGLDVNIGIFAVPTGTVSWDLDDLGGGDWEWVSEKVWFIHNNSSSNIFNHRWGGDGVCFYRDVNNATTRVLSNGTATSSTALVLTGFVPEATGAVSSISRALLYINADNTGSTSRIVEINSGIVSTELLRLKDIANLTGQVESKQYLGWFPIGYQDEATSLYYSWSGGVTGGLDVYVAGWALW